MNKFISIGVSLILITSNALAEDDIIQQAKNTIFPNISTEYTIEQFLWSPPESGRAAKWWKPETYVLGNERGNCLRQVWNRKNNDITVSCTTVDTPWIRTNSPFNVPFFGVNETNRTDQAYEESSMRWVRFTMDWSKFKKFKAIQKSENLNNFYYTITKSGKYIIYINLPNNIKQEDTPNLPLLSAQSSNLYRPYFISVPKKEFLTGKPDFFNDIDHGGKDSAFDNGLFYGSDFQELYNDFLNSFITCFHKKDENSKAKLIQSYRELLSYKNNLWNFIIKKFNVQYIARDSMTLDIKIRHLPTGQFKIIDAYTTVRWADGTQKKFRIENTPEKTILTIKKLMNKPHFGDADKERNNPSYEKLLETFWGDDLFTKKDAYAKNLWNLYHQPSMTIDIP